MRYDGQRRTSYKNIMNISLIEFFCTWLKIGFLSFGGPAGQIAFMHRILVDEKGWLDERRFLHALNFCMVLPGPEAMQLAAYSGWLVRGTWGGLVAGLLFILPGALVVYALTLVYVAFADLALVTAIFAGIKASVLAIVLQALARMGRRVLKDGRALIIALGSFAAIYFAGLPFPLIIFDAALAGVWAAPPAGPEIQDQDDQAPAPGDIRSSIKTAALFACLWLSPLLLITALGGFGSVFSDLFLFFSKLAVVSFGGAYAVLTYMTQQVVEHYGWLSPGEMVDGLGLAESTPGPLILVTQFAGFLAAYGQAGTLPPFVAGTLGTLLVLWVTFVPCFLWIFLGAPWMETLRRNEKLSAALAGITAAVVGVIAYLALWFALHSLFVRVAEPQAGPFSVMLPVWGSARPDMLVFLVLACAGLFMLRLPVLALVAVMALMGALSHLLF